MMDLARCDYIRKITNIEDNWRLFVLRTSSSNPRGKDQGDYEYWEYCLDPLHDIQSDALFIFDYQIDPVLKDLSSAVDAAVRDEFDKHSAYSSSSLNIITAVTLGSTAVSFIEAFTSVLEDLWKLDTTVSTLDLLQDLTSIPHMNIPIKISLAKDDPIYLHSLPARNPSIDDTVTEKRSP